MAVAKTAEKVIPTKPAARAAKKTTSKASSVKPDNQLLEALGSFMASVEFRSDGSIITANELFLQISGYSLKELGSRDYAALVGDGFAESPDHKAFWRRLLNGSKERIEVEFYGQKGNSIWLEANYIPVVGAGSKVSKILFFAKDISEYKNLQEHIQTQNEDLKATEEELRQSMEEMQATQEAIEKIQRKLEETLEQAVDAVITINSDKIVEYMNQAAEAMFGFSKDEVIGQNVKMLVPMEHRAAHDGYVDANIQTGVNKVTGKGRDLEMTRKDGSRFWGNLSLSKVKVDGELQFTAFIKDITDERKNREGATQIQNAVDTSFAAIEFTLDGFITRANENFLRVSGYNNQDELLGKHHRMFCLPEYANSSEYISFWDELGKGNVCSGEFERLRKDGTKLWLNASYTPVRNTDRVSAPK